MATFSIFLFGVLIGFFGLMTLVAVCIYKDEQTPMRFTIGAFFKELGEMIMGDGPEDRAQHVK